MRLKWLFRRFLPCAGLLLLAGCALSRYKTKIEETLYFEVPANNTQEMKPSETSPEDPVPTSPGKVLLFAYGRSGSTMLGTILQHSPEVYYVFEPLRQIDQFSKRQLSMVVNPLATKPGVLTKATEVLQSLLSCSYNPSLLRSLFKIFLDKSRDTQLLSRCHTLQPRPIQQAECLAKAQDNCMNSKKVVIKTIRYSTQVIEQLLHNNPDLRVIFLVREPIAMLQSQSHILNELKFLPFAEAATTICQRVLNDANQFIKLFQKYPQVIRFLRYEDLASHPEGVSRNTYKFLNLPWNEDIRREIQKQTHAGQSQVKGKNPLRVDPFGVYRPNSNDSANAWRKEVSEPFMKTVQHLCKDVMELLGYTQFTTHSQLRDLTVSALTDFKLSKLISAPFADLGTVTDV